MEEVCERENLKAALRQVKANKGSPGVDGMTVVGIKDYLKEYWPAIREQLLNGTYEPKPVRRVEIPKPDGGVRKLGIPTVSADCTRAQFAFGMDGDPSSVPSASRPALSGLEGTPNRRY
jgi:retron-type reverse transcriptase